MPTLKYKKDGQVKTVTGGAGVTSFNARFGNVVPQAEDYAEFYPSRDEVNAVQSIAETAQTTADSKAPMYTYGTEDIEAGSASTAITGTLHFVYE